MLLRRKLLLVTAVLLFCLVPNSLLLQAVGEPVTAKEPAKIDVQPLLGAHLQVDALLKSSAIQKWPVEVAAVFTRKTFGFDITQITACGSWTCVDANANLSVCGWVQSQGNWDIEALVEKSTLR